MNYLQERETLHAKLRRLDRELEETRASLSEEYQRASRLQLELDSKDSEVESLTQRLNMVSSDTASVSSGNDPTTDTDTDGVLGQIMLPLVKASCAKQLNFCMISFILK